VGFHNTRKNLSQGENHQPFESPLSCPEETKNLSFHSHPEKLPQNFKEKLGKSPLWRKIFLRLEKSKLILS